MTILWAENLVMLTCTASALHQWANFSDTEAIWIVFMITYFTLIGKSVFFWIAGSETIQMGILATYASYYYFKLC